MYIGKGYRVKAFEYFNIACDKNEEIGCGVVGSYYEQGKIVKKDMAMAKKFYAKGCNLGNDDDCSDYMRLLRVEY